MLLSDNMLLAEVNVNKMQLMCYTIYLICMVKLSTNCVKSINNFIIQSNKMYCFTTMLPLLTIHVFKKVDSKINLLWSENLLSF